MSYQSFEQGENIEEICETINHPDHYNTGKIECIDAMKSMVNLEQYYGFLKLNAIKYIWRCDYKGQNIEDLKKAVWYLNRLIKELENQ